MKLLAANQSLDRNIFTAATPAFRIAFTNTGEYPRQYPGFAPSQKDEHFKLKINLMIDQKQKFINPSSSRLE